MDNPIEEPTEEVEAEQTPTESTESTENHEPDSDTPEQSEGQEEEVHYLELDGEEHDLEEVRQWKQGNLRQSDYTKKTTKLADERKRFEAESSNTREQLLKSQTEVTALRDELKALVGEDESVNWVELRDSDPDRYIELKERADNRKAAIDKIKAERTISTDDPAQAQVEIIKFSKSNPEWLDDSNNYTDTYSKDMKLIGDYASNAGFTESEFKTLTKAHYLTALFKAAKYDQLQEKGREIKSKRIKVPVVTKPKAKKASQPGRSAADIFFPDD